MESTREFKAVNILLVEDSPSDVRLIREALRDSTLDISLRVARDGAEALDVLSSAKAGLAVYPDIILLDLNLPKKNGHEVLAEIKQDVWLKRIPVIVMTSSGNEEDIASVYRLNANCYIRKPSDLYEYQRVVRAIEDFWLMAVILPEPYHYTPRALAASVLH